MATRSEFGGHFRRNTLPAKDADMILTAEERARLLKLTGTEDVKADIDLDRSWHGLEKSPNSIVDWDD